ncbi:MAG: VWA domain-containing protein [Phycisphaerales bacterium]|nr:VWA domain-containing protein [Phycisphaerales bacterium]
MKNVGAIPWVISAAIHLTAAGIFLWLAALGVDYWERSETLPNEGAVFSFETAEVGAAPADNPSRDAEPSPVPGRPAMLASTATMRDALGVDRGGLEALAMSLPRVRRGLPLPKDVFSLASVRQESARRIVILIDASGSMIGGYQSAVEEIAAAVGRLSDEQRFAVIAFQSGRAIVAPPGDLVRAGPTLGQHGIEALKSWMSDKIVPQGSSDPRAAIRAAVELKPDSIVIVSTGLMGVADEPSARATLLADLDALNPRDERTNRRPIQIACVHLLDAEPLAALEAIAKAHGGPGAYRFIPRLNEIATAVAEAPAPDETSARLDAAVAALAAGQTSRARVELLRIGLGQPLHRSSPVALVSAAEISLVADHDAAAALALASTAAQGARAFGLTATAARAQSVATAAAEAIKVHRGAIRNP